MIPTDMARDATGSQRGSGLAAGGAPPGTVAPGAGSWRLVYQSRCGFCRWALARLLRLDRRRRLRPVALGTPEADTLLADVSPERRGDAWHLVAPDGRRWSAGAALPRLVRLLPGGRLPARAMEAAPDLTDRADHWVDERRPRLSRLLPESLKERARREIAHAREERSPVEPPES